MPMELVDVTEKPVDNVQGYLNHVQGSQATYPWTLLTDPRIAPISPANETQAIHRVVHVREGRMNGVARHVVGPAWGTRMALQTDRLAHVEDDS